MPASVPGSPKAVQDRGRAVWEHTRRCAGTVQAGDPAGRPYGAGSVGYAPGRGRPPCLPTGGEGHSWGRVYENGQRFSGSQARCG